MQRTNHIRKLREHLGRPMVATLLVLLLAASSGRAQTPDAATQAAIDVARAHTERFVTTQFPEGTATHHFQYTITSVPLETADLPGPTTQEVDILVGREQMQLKSSAMDFYQNTEHSVVVAHPSRVIVIAPSTQEALLARNTDEFAAKQLAMFNNIERAELRSYPGSHGASMQQITLHLDSAGQANFNSTRMEYHYKASTLQVVRTVVYYANHAELQQQSYDFTLLEYNSQTRFDAAPLEQIYNATGQLLPAYQGYQLINQTTP